MRRAADDLMKEGEFNAVRGKYFRKQDFNTFIKPIEMTDVSNIWRYVVYTLDENNLIKRLERELRSSCLVDMNYIEIIESQLPFDPVTLRLRKQESQIEK